MEIRDYIGKVTASNSDLLLLQDGADNLFKHITKANLLSGISSGGGGGSSPWQIKNANYTALVGDRLLIDISTTWLLTLPPLPLSGSEIDIYIISKAGANKLNLSLQGNKFKSTVPNSISCNTLYGYTKLIYINNEIGWLDTANIISTSGSYPVEVLKASPYVYLRLNESSGTQAIDSSINNRNCVYEGSVLFQQESSLSSQPENKSVRFNGSNNRIIVNPSTTGPSVYALECRFKTTSVSGGLFGFNGGGYDRDLYLVSGGKLKLYNYSGGEATTPLAYNDNLWHIVTATTNPRGVEIWVDGVLAVSSSNTGTQAYSGNWFAGWGAYGGYFNGLIDEISIWHTNVLPETIIARHQAAMG